MKKILVATTSPYKVEGISEAFRKFFPEEEIVVEACKVPSGVSRQPLNEEVYIGALNRATAVKKIKREELATYDYIIGCESGLIKQPVCWFNSQIVMIERKDGIIRWGVSDSFQIPTKYFKKIKESSIKDVFDEMFDGKGGVSKLSHGLVSRTSLIENSTIIALSSFSWPQ